MRRTIADRLRWYWKLQSRIDSFQVRHFGTSLLAIMRRSDALVIETIGRRSGRRHRATVMYWEEDGALFIGGGAAGMTKVDWVTNLRANRRAVAWVRRKAIVVETRELAGAEREHAKAEAFKRWPSAAKYGVRSGRPVPFFRLDAV